MLTPGPPGRTSVSSELQIFRISQNPDLQNSTGSSPDLDTGDLELEIWSAGLLEFGDLECWSSGVLNWKYGDLEEWSSAI